MSLSETIIPNSTDPPVSEFGINWKERDRCIDILNKPPPDNDDLYCPAVFDTWLCWDYARAGTTVKAPCPHYFKPEFNPNAFALKICNEDGTWHIHPESNKTWTNYLQCPESDRSLTTISPVQVPPFENGSNTDLLHPQSHIILYMSMSGYAISSILLIISIVIFNAFRQLKCTRVVLHQHLFVSFILTGVMWIIYYTKFMLNPGSSSDSPDWCKLLHVLTQYASVSNYFWMFCEGFFLHTIVVQAFSKQKKLLYACCVIGWGMPFLPVIAYVIARIVDTANDFLCWYHTTWATMMLSVPCALSVVINLVLLLNILRILLSKIRAFNTAELNQNKRAVKATLILVPLLGLQNLLTMIKPPMGQWGTFAWDLVSAILVSYQGTAVALIFCFLNGEVLTVLKRRWSQWRHNYDPAFLGRPSNNSTTMAMTLDDTTTSGAIFKNGSNRTSKPSKNNKDNTELQLMMPAGKSEKEVSFKA